MCEGGPATVGKNGKIPFGGISRCLITETII